MEFSYKAYRALNGVFCVYKPAGVPIKQVLYSISTNLAKDINALKHRPPKKIIRFHEENLGTNLPVITSVPDLSGHSLVLGQHYDASDFKMNANLSLAQFASGVSVVSVGSAKGYLYELVEARHMKVYHIKGIFGKGTNDFTSEGKVMEKTTFKHITHTKLDRILSSIQASHQRKMYESAGVHLQSQEAYELAAQGLIRPSHNNTGPLIYSIKCIDFKPPHFTLEIHAINETVDYLVQLVHEMGLELKSTAVTSQVQRIRLGYFTSQHALLRGDWHLNEIVSNIQLCRPLLRESTLNTDHSMKRLRAPGKTPPGLMAASSVRYIQPPQQPTTQTPSTVTSDNDAALPSSSTVCYPQPLHASDGQLPVGQTLSTSSSSVRYTQPPYDSDGQLSGGQTLPASLSEDADAVAAADALLQPQSEVASYDEDGNRVKHVDIDEALSRHLPGLESLWRKNGLT